MKNLSEIKIVTQRLKLIPTARSEWRLYHKLYGNSNVMKLFDSGKVNTEEETKKLVESFADRWEKGDLLSPLTIWNEKNQFIGFVNLRQEPCKQLGHVELGYMITEEHWNKGYANEAAHAAMLYLANLSKSGYKVGDEETLLGKRDLKAVVATAHPDNPASSRILEKLNMRLIGKANRQGYPRLFYYKPIVFPDLGWGYYRPSDLFINVSPSPVSTENLMRSKL